MRGAPHTAICLRGYGQPAALLPASKAVGKPTTRASPTGESLAPRGSRRPHLPDGGHAAATQVAGEGRQAHRPLTVSLRQVTST